MVLIENLKLGIRYEEISIVNYDNVALPFTVRPPIMQIM